MAAPSKIQSIVAALRPLLGPQGVLAAGDVPERNSRDWSSAAAIRPELLLRPADTPQLSAALRVCHEHAQAVVVQGGLTGLCGGATPQAGEVALSTERMNRIEALDTLGSTATVQAGVILENLQRAASEAGLSFPLDFGSRGSCTLGGNLACNAGGNSVIRYGVARELCLGLEAVLADGTVLTHLNRMTKNTSGFDLKQLFIGSEGTLGVISRAVLRLYPAQRDKATAVVAADSFAGVLAVLQMARTILGAGLCAFEVMWADYLDEVRGRLPAVRQPLGGRPAFAILLEVEAHQGAGQALADFLEQAMANNLISDGVLAQSQSQAEEFWALRDAVAQLLQIYERSMAFDVSLPLTTLQAYCDEVAQSLQAEFPALTALRFAHLGDGTLHYIIDAPDTASKARILERVLAPLARHDGAVSAEHGIGVAKRDYLSLCRSAADIEQMRRLKSLLDPRAILNPGRVFS